MNFSAKEFKLAPEKIHIRRAGFTNGKMQVM
jgi:hypothetical protein